NLVLPPPDSASTRPHADRVRAWLPGCPPPPEPHVVLSDLQYRCAPLATGLRRPSGGFVRCSGHFRHRARSQECQGYWAGPGRPGVTEIGRAHVCTTV